MVSVFSLVSSSHLIAAVHAFTGAFSGSVDINQYARSCGGSFGMFDLQHVLLYVGVILTVIGVLLVLRQLRTPPLNRTSLIRDGGITFAIGLCTIAGFWYFFIRSVPWCKAVTLIKDCEVGLIVDGNQVDYVQLRNGERKRVNGAPIFEEMKAVAQSATAQCGFAVSAGME